MKLGDTKAQERERMRLEAEMATSGSTVWTKDGKYGFRTTKHRQAIQKLAKAMYGKVRPKRKVWESSE